MLAFSGAIVCKDAHRVDTCNADQRSTPIEGINIRQLRASASKETRAAFCRPGPFCLYCHQNGVTKASAGALSDCGLRDHPASRLLFRASASDTSNSCCTVKRAIVWVPTPANIKESNTLIFYEDQCVDLTLRPSSPSQAASMSRSSPSSLICKFLWRCLYRLLPAPKHIIRHCDALQLPSHRSTRRRPSAGAATRRGPERRRAEGCLAHAQALHWGSRGREAIRPGVLGAPAPARSWGRTAPATRHSGNRLAPGADLGPPLPASRQMGWPVSPRDRDTKG